MIAGPNSRPKSGVFDKAYLAVSILGLALSAIVTSYRLGDFRPEIMILLLSGVLSAFGQASSIRYKLPIHYISFLFCFLFMSLIPILQIGYHIDPVFDVSYAVILSSLAVLCFTALGLISLRGVKKGIHQRAVVSERQTRRYNNFLLAGLVFALCVSSFLLFGDALFSSREGFGTAIGRVFGDRATAGALTNFLVQTPFFGSVIGLREAQARRERVWIIIFSSLLLAAAVLNNPIVNPRFKLAGTVLFFIDYFFRGRRIKALIFALICGIALAPLFQIFRTDHHDIKDATYGDRYLSTDYDAFQMSCYTFLTVEKNGNNWGSYILGATLFFVPRAAWPQKPEPSSYEVYNTALHYRDLGTNNLSLPFMVEGYFAFSWLGLISFSLLYWWGISKLHLNSLANSSSIAFVFRSAAIGIVLIFLRGPLITSVTNLVANWAAAALAWAVFCTATRARHRILPRQRLGSQPQ